MISAMILGLALAYPQVHAHILLENPKDSNFVTWYDIKAMANPQIRKALRAEAVKRKLDEDYNIILWDQEEPGAWVLALHISRQTVEEHREKEKEKKKGKNID